MAEPPPEQLEQDASAAPRPARRGGRLRRLAALTARLILFAVAAAYFTGQMLTDRAYWTQWLFWTPPEAWLAAAWMLAVLAAALEPSGPRQAWGRRTAILAAVVVSLHVSMVHWRIQNALLRTPGRTSLRVYHWNATEATDASLQAFLRQADPFAVRRETEAVVVLANPPLRLGWGEIVRMLADRPIAQADLTRHLRRGGRLVIISGPPMTATGWTSLGLDGKTPEPDLRDHGTAIFARLETAEGPTTIWGWDWPSDPSRGRMSFVQPSRAALQASTHVHFAPTPAGPMKRSTEAGFPPAEIVVGDFNTARRSAAIERLLPDLASAHAQAGIGPDYGWPLILRIRGKDRETIPFLGLDQAFVDDNRWRATAYRMIDMGEGTHRAQELMLTRVRATPGAPARPAEGQGASE